MASSKQNHQEPSRDQLADKVVTPKHRYYFPQYSASVEAESADEALKLVKAKKKAAEQGDDDQNSAQETDQ